MPAPDRYVCIHGHFYQPPRENPWLETVETQESAAPYHDWNDRITAECYAPNGAARIVNHENRIVRILNNYGWISFNFGPTLLSWLKDNAPRAHRMILDADLNSRQRFSGHGSAMAQVYNHIIMPLASTRDRITQIRWGIADFESRFARKPEGMWLSETAVDTETLELLAEHGIKFVVLAPSQCARVRPLVEPAAPKPAETAKLNGASRKAATASSATAKEGSLAASEVLQTPAVSEAPQVWTETPDATVDTTHPYLVRLSEGRTIAIFFYDGPRSRAIAFEGLLNDGENFARRLLGGFNASDRPQLVHVATDGESYGHHHRYGEMALAFALKWIHEGDQARLTNYGEFLEKFPPTYEAQIVEDTSWSCAHGIERWRSSCGCNGGVAGWNQQWRTPLRNALDWLRDTVAPLALAKAKDLFQDLDRARNGYIQVVLDREKRSAFLALYAQPNLTEQQHTEALELMELERHAMLMYTSCGWFFDEISGIETVQIIAYASRVLQLAASLFGEPGAALETEFVRQLGEAKSNVAAKKDAAAIYNDSVKGMRVGLEQVAAHYAISSIFKTYAGQTDLFCYTIERQSYEVVSSGRGRIVMGQAHICSNLTDEQETVLFAVLHFGDQNVTAAVKRYDESQADAHAAFVQNVRTATIRADFPAVIRLFDGYFPGPSYSIQSLFRDEQLRIVEMILKTTLPGVEDTLIAIYRDQSALLQFLSQSGLPRPEALNLAANFAINAGMRRALESDPVDAIELRSYLGLSRADQVTLDKPRLGFIADQKMKRAMLDLQEEVVDTAEHSAALENTLLVAQTLSELPFELNLWQAQNIWYDIYRRIGKSCSLDPTSWCKKFFELGKMMRISVEDLVLEDEGLPVEATSATAHT
jgi:alpha-amylase/alpha-mannosidase (GH57 family)